MDNAIYDEKRELIKLLNVRVEIVKEDDGYRLDLSCELSDSGDYVRVTRRTNTMLQNHIRVSTSFRLPKRKEALDFSALVEVLFASMG